MKAADEVWLPPRFEAGRLEAGCDEAGRGCLAGPVYAAAVILPPDFRHPWLNDSKKLTEARRLELREIIREQSLAWAVASCSEQEIDEITFSTPRFWPCTAPSTPLACAPKA